MSKVDLKRYAREVFNKYTSGRLNPEWEGGDGWEDQCDVGLMEDCVQGGKESNSHFHFVHSLEESPQVLTFQGKSGTDLDPAFPKILQSIYYNASAANTIRTFGLSQRASLERLRVALLGNKVSLEDMNIPDFQPSAVVIKTVWEVINPDDPHTYPGPNPTGTSAKVHLFGKDVPLQEKPDGDGRLLYPELKNWNGDHLRVDLSNKDDCSAKYSGPNVVFSLGCFHYRALSVEDFQDVNPDYVSDIKYKCHNKTCYMILVGFHIMTRETPNWVWMTYWLTTEKAHPGRLDPWSLFDLDATVNNDSSGRTANPYLEGLSSGMNTNCLECHRHAVYNPVYGSEFASQKYATGRQGTDGSESERDLHSPGCYFELALQTHFLWTVAKHSDNRQSPQSGDPCPPWGSPKSGHRGALPQIW